MSHKQNLTVQLDRETIRKAKVLAAQKGTSVSRLVASTIENEVAREDAYQAARRRVGLIRFGGHQTRGGYGVRPRHTSIRYAHLAPSAGAEYIQVLSGWPQNPSRSGQAQ
jgi:hypothetical protein